MLAGSGEAGDPITAAEVRVGEGERQPLVETSGERAHGEGLGAAKEIAARVLEVGARSPEGFLRGAEVRAHADRRQSGDGDSPARQIAAAIDDLEAEAPG